MKPLILIIIASVIFLTGCTAMVHELKTDPAIAGITGWWFSMGLEASPSSGGIPFPVIKFGRGTMWRVGVSDEVTVRTGEGLTVNPGSPGQEKVGGEASLIIRTKGTSQALEKMKDLYK